MRTRSIVHIALVGAAALLLVGGLAISRGAPGQLDALGRLALGLAIIVTAAQLGGHLAVHIGQPAVLGELAAGMALGSLAGLAKLEFVGADPYLDILSRIGMLVGAFAAGLVLEDTHSAMFVQRGERPLGELLQPMTAFLVPVFFVLIGFHTNLAALADPALLALAVALSLAAVVGKLASAFGVVNRDVSRLTVAVGMIPRGEVSLVFAALGSAPQFGGAPLLDRRGYAAIVTVVILTTLVTPPALKWSIGSQARSRGVTTPAASAGPWCRVETHPCR